MQLPTSGDHAVYRSIWSDANDARRYSAVTFENGSVVVYDEEDERAWLRSDDAVDLETAA
ncbi:MAG: hypothetical protein ABEJ26_10340 [Halosimplex sp.]